MPRTRIGAAEISVLFLLVATAVVAIGSGVQHLVLNGENDFSAFYAGSKVLASGGDLYSPAENMRLHAQEGRRGNSGLVYVRPPFHAMLFWPLTWLPYKAAYWTFQAFSIACFWLFVRLFRADLSDPVRAGLAIPAIACLINAQDVFLVLVFAAASFVLARRNRDYLSGVALAVCAVKFHLFLFLPLVMLRHRRWRMISGASTALIALGVVSLVLAGADWPFRFINAVQNPAIQGTPIGGMPNLHGVAGFLGFSPALDRSLTLFVVAVFIAAIWRTQFETGFAIALIGGVLTAYHSYLQDYSVLLLAAPVLARAVPWLRSVLDEFVGPLPYILMFIAATVPLVILFLIFASVAAALGAPTGQVDRPTGAIPERSS